MNSLWQHRTPLPDFPALDHDLQTDVLVIGGGMAGLLTAYYLQEKGIDTVLVEQDRICGGTTGRTCGELGPRDQRYVMVDPESGTEVRSVGDTANLCAQRGDSGGPVLSQIGEWETVIGLVSGTRSAAQGGRPECPGDGVDSAAGSIAYATAGQVLDVIYEVVPDAQFEPVA